MLTNICPTLPMRDKNATRYFYTYQLGFREYGKIDYDGYLVLAKDNIKIHFFESILLDVNHDYVQVYIGTDNIEQLYQSFLDRNVTIHSAGHLQLKPCGQYEFSILDPDHNLLTFESTT